jgi:hypothetical protein
LLHTLSNLRAQASGRSVRESAPIVDVLRNRQLREYNKREEENSTSRSEILVAE